MPAEAAFMSELLSEKPELLQRIIAFNLEAASPALRASDPAVADPLCAAVAAADPGIRHALRALAPSAARRAPGESKQTGFWNFADESTRLALFDAESLEHLGKLASAAAFGSRIALAISRAERAALKNALGAEACAYAVARGRWTAGALAPQLQALAPQGPLADRAAALARIVLEAAALRWPGALAEIAAPKLKALALPPAALPDAAAEGDMPLRIWHFLKKIILREMDPSWKKYFD